MDASILQSCIQGQRQAQEMLYEEYKVYLFVLCKRYFNEVEDAEDALQEGFIKVFRDINQYNPEKGTFKSWINKVFVHTCLEKIRKKKWSFGQLDEIKEESIQEDVYSKLNLQELTKLIQSLPHGYRTVFNLYAIEGYSHQEISTLLGISESTSKTQFMKAKNALKQKLELIFND